MPALRMALRVAPTFSWSLSLHHSRGLVLGLGDVGLELVLASQSGVGLRPNLVVNDEVGSL